MNDLARTLENAGIRCTPLDETRLLVHGAMRGRSPFAHCLLIRDRVCALVDSGCGAEILDTLLQHCHVDLVINTHAHPDHTSGNRTLQEQGAEIMVPAHDECIGEAEPLAVRLVGEDLAATWMSTTLAVTGYRNFTPDGTYGEGREFNLGSTRLTALHTPGHLTDHHCLLDPDSGLLFAGDIDLSPFGPWYGHRESDLTDFRASIERVAGLNLNTYISAHARPVNNAHITRRLASYARCLDNRTKAIRRLAPEGEPFTARDITLHSPIYALDHATLGDPLLLAAEETMIRQHLETLAEQGIFTKENGHFKQ